jgi:uncharacterized protein (DUF2235 family)
VRGPKEKTMALYAFDGTGNEDQEDETRDTNVVKFFVAYDDPAKNADPDAPFGSLYLKGIGRAAHTLIGKGVSESLGVGGHHRVRQAMSRLRKNLARGDGAIDVVGFSRGAALALSFANTIASHLPAQRVRFLGVFDVVGQFGLPGTELNAGHVLKLPENVDVCRHAMALDEGRRLFPLSRLCDDTGKAADCLIELWFRGVHSDVGGGNGNLGLNWIPLHWMFMGARAAGVPIVEEAIERNRRNRTEPQQISDHKIELTRKRSFFATDCLHSSVALVDGMPGRPHNNPTIALRRMSDDGELVAV